MKRTLLCGLGVPRGGDGGRVHTSCGAMAGRGRQLASWPLIGSACLLAQFLDAAEDARAAVAGEVRTAVAALKGDSRASGDLYERYMGKALAKVRPAPPAPPGSRSPLEPPAPSASPSLKARPCSQSLRASEFLGMSVGVINDRPRVPFGCACSASQPRRAVYWLR